MIRYRAKNKDEKNNLVISERYIIGSITDLTYNPIAIPKEQIREIAYVYYEIATIRYNLDLTLRALEDCGAPIIDITQEKRYGRRRK